MEELKSRTTKYLASVGIEVPAHLPTIEGVDEVTPRNSKDVAGRLSALAYVIGLGFGAKSSDLLEDLQQYELMSFVSEREKGCFAKKSLVTKIKLICLGKRNAPKP